MPNPVSRGEVTTGQSPQKIHIALFKSVFLKWIIFANVYKNYPLLTFSSKLSFKKVLLRVSKQEKFWKNLQSSLLRSGHTSQNITHWRHKWLIFGFFLPLDALNCLFFPSILYQFNIS